MILLLCSVIMYPQGVYNPFQFYFLLIFRDAYKFLIFFLPDQEGCWLLAVGFWLLAFGYWLLAFGCWLLAFGYWLLAVGLWLLAVGYWLLAFGYWLLAIGYWLLTLSFWQRTGHEGLKEDTRDTKSDCYGTTSIQ
jgi:hypothetical protein